MREREYISTVTDGQLQSNVQKEFLKDLKEFEGERVLIKLSKKRRNRSLSQNRYYFGVVCESFQIGAKEVWGEDISKEEAHENLKKECNYKELVSEDSGEIFRIVKSTANLNTLGFEKYLDRCRKFIHTWFNVTVPLPNEQAAIEFTNK